MDNENYNKCLCKSVFKDGRQSTSKEEFTKIWIELINRIEKNKYAKF